MSLRSEVRDQAAHLIVAVLILMMLEPHSLPGWMFAGFLIGLVREVTEAEFARDGRGVDPALIWSAIKTSKADLAAWTVGGALAFALVG